jgi:hypothetical protein
MATIEENLRVSDESYGWPAAGDEWSAHFGGTEALWHFVLLPRIHAFIPSAVILEIAPGFGRWTQYLKAQCQARFASETHVRFHVNDGTSLAAVPDVSVDFVFSFDSLVHAEADVVEAYLREIEQKLTADGVGFIHHSNIGAYPQRLKLRDRYYRLPRSIRERIITPATASALLSINLQAGRAKTMSAVLFRQLCEKAGLKCICQETLNWQGKMPHRCHIDLHETEFPVGQGKYRPGQQRVCREHRFDLPPVGTLLPLVGSRGILHHVVQHRQCNLPLIDGRALEHPKTGGIEVLG